MKCARLMRHARAVTRLCVFSLGLMSLSVQAQAPLRVVSLLPSTTELVCELGACDRLVAVDQHTNHPQSVNKLPRVGAMGAWSIEALVRARPDLVLISRDPQLAERLKQLGLAYRVVDPRNLDEVRSSFEEVAQALGLGVAPGQRLWQDLQSQLQSQRAAMPASTQGQRVHVELDSAGYVAGPSSYLGELIQALGMRTAITLQSPAYPHLSPEWVVREQPDWILLLFTPTTPLSQRPGWSQLSAVKAHQVCQFKPSEVDVLVRPGPRLVQAARLLRQCMEGRARER